jgi:hypothetical protein
MNEWNKKENLGKTEFADVNWTELLCYMVQ